MAETITIDVSALYHATGTAKLRNLDSYIAQTLELAGAGNDIVLTGQGPIWLYLKVAHALHGKARKLTYNSPNTGGVDVVIFDHNPF